MERLFKNRIMLKLRSRQDIIYLFRQEPFNKTGSSLILIKDNSSTYHPNNNKLQQPIKKTNDRAGHLQLYGNSEINRAYIPQNPIKETNDRAGHLQLYGNSEIGRVLQQGKTLQYNPEKASNKHSFLLKNSKKKDGNNSTRPSEIHRICLF